MNPFQQKPQKIEKSFRPWKEVLVKAYDKQTVDPYTRLRVILMNGTEFESVRFSHAFTRHCTNNDLRRDLALTRRNEQLQQKRIASLKPLDENILEHTIGYEQLAVDLTANLAMKEKNEYVRQQLNFALLEDFDHLYRYSNLLEGERGITAEWLVGRYTEIMPARPTIAHHRHPFDNVKRCSSSKTADVQTVLSTMIITAAEQQTMNYYMNVTNFAQSDIGRRLYQEIAMVEEEHVSHYESLMDANLSPFEKLLWHEYTECYLYWSCYQTETDAYVKNLWEENLYIEIAHLHKAVELLQKYENKEWQEVIPCGDFPAPISLHENVDYVRKILTDTVQYTSLKDDYAKIKDLPSGADFFILQNAVNPTTDIVPSHNVIEKIIQKNGFDYRYQTAPNPIPQLRNRREDNTSVGRKPNATSSTNFTCND